MIVKVCKLLYLTSRVRALERVAEAARAIHPNDTLYADEDWFRFNQPQRAELVDALRALGSEGGTSPRNDAKADA